MQSRTTNRTGLGMLTLAMALLTATTTFAAAEKRQIGRGDVDGDGLITVSDLILFTEWWYGVTPVENSIEALDVDNDGRVTVNDYNLMHKVVYFAPRTLPQQATIKFERGDVNGDGRIDLVDVVMLPGVVGGRAMRAPLDAADVNGDGFINDADTEALFRKLFGGGNENETNKLRNNS